MSIRGQELHAAREFADGKYIEQKVQEPLDSPEKDFIKAAAWIFTLAIVGGCGAIYWVLG